MQLVAYGAQDAYLTTKPEVTFFKVIYKRHTNFAMESMEQTLNGTANFGNKVVCKVSRNGDLMGPCYVEATLPALASASEDWVNRVGFRLLKQTELRVGGQMIDRQYATWMQVWAELTHTTDQKSLLDKIVGTTGTDGAAAGDSAGDSALTLYIPLMFSFCRNPGLALPLIALQYHEVEIHIEFETLNNCVADGSASSLSLTNVSLWVDYIFLDAEERKEFAANPHEYLIETVQTQEQSVSSGTNSVRLTFNHPTKELVWVCRRASPTDAFTDFTDGSSGNMITLAKLKLNGQDRFAQRTGAYFNYVQPYQHHTGKPDLGINAYSFGLKPEEHQPSGTCNFSRIDNINLDVTAAAAGTLTVMAHSYNVFRVASGMGGLSYAN
jgi:hypothetical protein